MLVIAFIVCRVVICTIMMVLFTIDLCALTYKLTWNATCTRDAYLHAQIAPPHHSHQRLHITPVNQEQV